MNLSDIFNSLEDNADELIPITYNPPKQENIYVRYFKQFIDKHIAHYSADKLTPEEKMGVDAANTTPELMINIVTVDNPQQLRNFILRAIPYIGYDGNYNWIDTSNITVLTNVFQNIKDFNGDITGWNVSNVTAMSNTFNGCAAFKQDLSSWANLVSKVKTMFHCFSKSAYATNPALKNIILKKWNCPLIPINKMKTFIF